MKQQAKLPLTLRPTWDEDLETLFLFQADEEAACMAAFVNEKYQDREVYIEKWKRLLRTPGLNIQTILIGDVIAGGVSSYELEGELQVTYGLDKKWWGQGYGTQALREFLRKETRRPLYGRVAFDNQRSAAMLRACGFREIGKDRLYAHARGQEIEEIIFVREG